MKRKVITMVAVIAIAMFGFAGCKEEKKADGPEVTATAKPTEAVATETPEPTATEMPEPTVTPVPKTESIEVGSYVTYGSYEQDNNLTNGKEKIEWRVLDIKNEWVLLLSRYGLDAKAYHDDWTEVTWETSSLRAWLNGEFFTEAFTKAEQEGIELWVHENEESWEYGTDGGGDTLDYVFCLGRREFMDYFVKNGADSAGGEDAVCFPTEYAIAQGAMTETNGLWNDGSTWWWLRDPGKDNKSAMGVMRDGSMNPTGTMVFIYYYTARPAIWVEKEALLQDFETGEVAENDRDETVEMPITVVDLADAKVGDYVSFGVYEQDDVTSNGAEAIEWKVLDIKDGKALLLSRYGLDQKVYHEALEAITWENCSLRTWLNGEFYDSSFTDAEREAIALTAVQNPDNPLFGTECGNDVEDYVFCLSVEEARIYFEDTEEGSPERVGKGTLYAIKHGASTTISDDGTNGNGSYWLRTTGGEETRATYVGREGKVNEYGFGVNDYHIMVRPVMWVEME
ncbi:MAG: hypothetical protein IJW37_02005 [Lachnospiraceae bacterium]|nr:hypothetical protein [Lachnospiraceae bacterium]